MIFNSPTSWTVAQDILARQVLHRTRILSPNIACLASLTASVAILDSHHSLGYFESTLATEVRLWPAFSISEESRTFVFEFLNGNGVAQSH